MRRVLVPPIVTALLLASAAPVMGRHSDEHPWPIRSLAPASPLTLPGGTYCAFDVTLSNTIDRGAVIEFAPTDDGAQRIMFNGFIRVEATGNGQTFSAVNSTHATLWFFADGSVTVTFSGPVIAFYAAAEEPVSDLDQGIWYVRGHGSESYAPDGTLLEAVSTGKVVDVCAALGG